MKQYVPPFVLMSFKLAFCGVLPVGSLGIHKDLGDGTARTAEPTGQGDIPWHHAQQ